MKSGARVVIVAGGSWMDGELGRLDPAAIQEVRDQLGPTCATRMSSMTSC